MQQDYTTAYRMGQGQRQEQVRYQGAEAEVAPAIPQFHTSKDLLKDIYILVLIIIDIKWKNTL